MNFVFIMTDTQNRNMVGAYGNPRIKTPCLDKLANTGVRFTRAYTTCPLCTPARSAIFSGTHPVVNGAWCNNVPPYPTHPLMGTIFSEYGFRTGYTGKWHLDGSGYFGDGIPGGGFEPDWWYDGKRYAEDIGPEMFNAYTSHKTIQSLRDSGFTRENIWGHRVANRAIDFLEKVGDEPFVLAVSFDEPHGPFVAPPEYWEEYKEFQPLEDGTQAQLGSDKPALQNVHYDKIATRNVNNQAPGYQNRLYACNSYIDSEIGRVIESVEKLHADDTVIVYTSDHGDMLGHHGLNGKGPMMYDEICNIPFIVRFPNCTPSVSDALVSHVDIIPTFLDYAGLPQPDCLHGKSLRPVLEGQVDSVNETVMTSFSRFAINHDDFGEFYPVRMLTNGHYKLVINLFEEDELYDLESDPCEMTNQIMNPELIDVRDRLHDRLLAEMDRIRDPFRSFRWGDRSWRTVRNAFYYGGKRRDAPQRFPFQPSGIEAKS